jgi:response regulator RpfG family c-di-GMP phosphodiesterase
MMKQPHKKILYVDDERINLELFKINFKGIYDVIVCDSALKGLQVIENENIDVIVSDLKMPEMNGIEFIETIKHKTPEKVCILLTAYIEPEVMLKAINQELIFRYVTKPWNKQNMQSIIDLAFEKAAKSSAN